MLVYCDPFDSFVVVRKLLPTEFALVNSTVSRGLCEPSGHTLHIQRSALNVPAVTLLAWRDSTNIPTVHVVAPAAGRGALVAPGAGGFVPCREASRRTTTSRAPSSTQATGPAAR